MLKAEHISNELKELQSKLPIDLQVPYQVPAGYFEALPAKIWQRIVVQEELKVLSPLLSSLDKTTPYQIPAGYFEDISASGNVDEENISPAQEIETLSPLLSGMSKEIPFQVPLGYFENISLPVSREKAAPAKLVRLNGRSVFRYAAAAIVTGVIAITGFLIVSKNGAPSSTTGEVLAKFTIDVKKMNATEQDDLLEFIDAGISGEDIAQVEQAPVTEEVQDLLRDVSDEELADFNQQTEDIEGVSLTN